MKRRAPTIPKPFASPVIEVGTPITRSWQTINPQNLVVGDIVQDRGSVEKVDVMGARTLVTFISREAYSYSPNETVYAFTEGVKS